MVIEKKSDNVGRLGRFLRSFLFNNLRKADMPRLKREILPNHLYHIYNRGVEKNRIFYSEKDYNRFLEKMFIYKHQTGVKILSYALLPNHYHFLMQEPDQNQHGPGPVRSGTVRKSISRLQNI